MRRGYFFLLILIVFLIIPCSGLWAWGNYGHSHITGSAVEDLPLSMVTVFRPVKQWLSDTSTDNGIRTGWDPNESYFHYIDADSNPGCPWPFVCLPRNYANYTTQYGINNGINVYMVDSLTLVLSTAYRNWNMNKTGSNFTTVLYWMTRVAHYVEDLYQPFHTTSDYDPNGVHSRYESNMLNQFIPTVSSTLGIGALYQSNPLEYSFSIISVTYPYYHTIAMADTAAQNAAGSTSSPTYYTLLWSGTRSFTTTFLNQAAISVASLWYTAWINAGIPVPVELSEFTTLDDPIENPKDW